MVVKSHADARVERQVGRDIVLCKLYLSILYVFRMYELDLVDHVHLLQHHRAGKAVKIASCYKAAHFTHFCSSLYITGKAPASDHVTFLRMYYTLKKLLYQVNRFNVRTKKHSIF